MWLERMDYNMTEFINKIGSVMSQDDLNVTMNLKHPDGDIRQINLKSAGKFYGEIYNKVGEALFYFKRELYVDAVNGNDTNTGNSDSPLRTLKRAFKIVPSGGSAIITCVGGYTLRASEHRRYTIHNQRITLTTDSIQNKINVIIDDIDYDNNQSMIGVQEGLFILACSVDISVDSSNFLPKWQQMANIDYASFIGVNFGSFMLDTHVHDLGGLCEVTQHNKSTLVKVFSGNVYFNRNYFNVSNHVNDGGADRFNILAVRGSATLSTASDTSYIVDDNGTSYRVFDIPGKFHYYTSGINYNSGIPTNVIGATGLLPNGENNRVINANIDPIYIPSYAANVYITATSDATIEHLRYDDYDYHQLPWNSNEAKQTNIMLFNKSNYNITLKQYVDAGDKFQFSFRNATNADIVLQTNEFAYARLTKDPMNLQFNWYISKG